jgi:hypothetical protein
MRQGAGEKLPSEGGQLVAVILSLTGLRFKAKDVAPAEQLDKRGEFCSHGSMKNRVLALLLLLFVVMVFSFGTWQMFAGNLEAAFISLPFLVIAFLFMQRWR